MASREGATIDGTDGSDYSHRERVVSQYYTSSKTKASLSYTLYLHIFVAVCFLAKLSPAILDRFDVFILSLEELNIPKPLLWEWIWFGGSFLTYFVGSSAIKASKVGKIQVFMFVGWLVGIVPIIYCFAAYFSDASAYCFEPHNKIYQTWKGYPVGILWYIFGILAMNIHIFEMKFAYTLLDAWSVKRKTN